MRDHRTGDVKHYDPQVFDILSDLAASLGRPNAEPKKVEAARRYLAQGMGILKTAKLAGLGTGTVQRLKQASSATASR